MDTAYQTLIDSVRARHRAQEAIRVELMRWCDPRPELSGIMAWEIAGKILDAIEKARAEEVEA